MSSNHFYRELKALELPVSRLFQEALFTPVPEDWFVIISDIRNSTAAVQAGRHQDVNLVAAGSLIAALNVARAHQIDIPFFFGGDGGTVLAPGSLLNEIIAGLCVHHVNSTRNFGLPLYIGSIPVREVLEAGQFLKIAKLKYCPGFHKPVILGDGLRYAERLIKQSFPDGRREMFTPADLDMNGLECRWDRVKPPITDNEIVCYLIEAVHPEAQLEVYGSVLTRIDEIYGDLEQRHPLSLERLQMLHTFGKIKKEMMVKFGQWKPAYFLRTWIQTLLARLFLKYNLKTRGFRGAEYLTQLIANADTLTIDGRISTIITGSREKRLRLLEYLTGAEQAGRLRFGHYISRESVMTCYIENRNPRHIHFVDGAEGGYTEAARELKQKISQAEKPMYPRPR